MLVVAAKSNGRSEWALPNIFGYWDEQTRAISRFAQRLDELPDGEMSSALQAVRENVGGHATALSDEDLKQVAYVVADDLYKAASAIEFLSNPLFLYLEASAGTFFGLLRERGYLLHFLVDNTFPDFERPLKVFTPWLSACGIVYVCPQVLAGELMKRDGIEISKLADHLPRYIAEARHVATQLVEQCVNGGRHFLFLDLDSEEGSFEIALASQGARGVINVIRNEAPVPGSNIRVHLPTERAT